MARKLGLASSSKAQNGTIITFVDEPDDRSSRIFDRTLPKKPRVERPFATSDIGAQADALDYVFPSTSVSEVQRLACATHIFTMFNNRTAVFRAG